MTYINYSILSLPLPLPRSFCLTLDSLNQLWDILFPLIHILPDKLISIRRRARITTPPTNKNFSIVPR